MRQKLSSGDRKTQVVAAARSLFARGGFAEVTLDDIAAMVGISRPRVVELFGSRQNIYEAMAETVYRSHLMDRDPVWPMERNHHFA